MPTIQSIDRFAHNNFTVPGGGPYSNVIGTTPTRDTTIVAPGESASMKINPSAAGSAVDYPFPIGTPTLGWIGFWYRMDVVPGGDIRIAQFNGTDSSFGYIAYAPAPTPDRIYHTVDPSGTDSVNYPTLGTWVWIESIYDAGTNPHAIYTRVNGVDIATPITSAFAASTVLAQVRVGAAASNTYTAYYGRFSIGTATSTSDWLGIPTTTLAVVQRRSVENTTTSVSTISPTTTVNAGTLAVLCASGTGGGKTIASVTDSVGGNTWGVDVTGGSGRLVGFASAQIVNPITSGDTISITWTTSVSDSHYIWVMEVTGAATSSAFDKSALGSGVGATSVSSGPTATLSQANEICFAYCITGVGSSWTKDPAWSNPTTPSNFEAALEYLIVSSTAGVTATGTWSPATSYEFLIATYRGLGGGSLPPINWVAGVGA